MLRKILFTLIIVFTGSLWAQLGFIPLAVDHAIYRAPSGHVYAEIYLSFYQNNLNYISKEGHYEAQYLAVAEILQGDSVINRGVKNMVSKVDSIRQISSSRQFLNTFAFELMEGSYQAKVVVRDVNSNNTGEYMLDFDAREFPQDSLTVSDIQLASSISQDQTKSEFYKNSLTVVPNPGGIYNVALPVVYYYAEAYNLAPMPQTAGEYSVACTITDQGGNVIKTYPAKSHKKPGTSAVLMGGYNVVTLPAATYFLNLTVEDQQTSQEVHVSKRFTVIKQGKRQQTVPDSLIAGKSQRVDISQYSHLSEEEMDKEFEATRYFAKNTEKEIYKTLDKEGKRTFLTNFWKRYDPMPNTDENEFKLDYIERLNYANANFGTMHKEGWKTDRGRVLLTYGRPDEIERHYMDIGMNPYEIWQYHNLEGGAIFVFGDRTGFGEFELLHSTYSRELYQPDWEKLLTRTHGGYNDFNNQQ